MEQALMISTALLWLAVLSLAAISFAVVRQLGVFHERIRPAGALMIDSGPALGSVPPVFELTDIGGRGVKVGGAHAQARRTLLFFLSPSCPVCKSLLPLLPSIQAREAGDARLGQRGKPGLDVVLASDGELAEHRRFHDKARLAAFPYVLSPELGRFYQIGKLPYAILFDESGTVRAKGLVNSREHLESLFEADARRLSGASRVAAPSGTLRAGLEQGV